MLRRGCKKHIALAAYLAVAILPNTCNAFWMRFIWKNDLIGPNAIYDGTSALILYTLAGEAPILSPTLKFPEGATECRLVQELSPKESGPSEPLPGIIGIMDSSRAGRKVEYLSFFEDEVCGTNPTLFIRLEPSKDNRGTSGNFYFVNLLNHGVLPVKSWKQADPDDLIDRRIIETWGRPRQDPSQMNPSRVTINIPDPDLAGTMRWRYAVVDEKIQPSTLLKSDDQIGQQLGTQLVQRFAQWLGDEEKYRKKQEDLNLDFGSEDFNFVPGEALGSQRVAAYMVQEEYKRLGLPVPSIRPQQDQGFSRGPRRQSVMQNSDAANTRSGTTRSDESNTNTNPSNLAANGEQRSDSQGQRRVSSAEGNRRDWTYPVDRVSSQAGMNFQYPSYDQAGLQQTQYSNYDPSGPQGYNNPLGRTDPPNNNQRGSESQNPGIDPQNPN
ncbi:hypothetical protein TWF718_007845 [Orbilia javanica]|uniref:Uncharacterized protein n=1 Tax=Orbilia javanica TaxID=47235 RepID=A0AAN8MVX0_9PEZI